MKFDEETRSKLQVEICERIATGETLQSICRDDHTPAWRTVYDWLDADKDFAANFAHARVLGFDAIAEQALDIAEDGRNDWIERESERTGKTYIALNDEHVQRSKLRIETRLKLLAKWDPKRYGDRTSMELTGANGGPVQFSDTERSARIASLLAMAALRREKGDDTQPAEDDASDLV